MATQLGAQADRWQTIDAKFLTPLPSQVMATPRRAALSSTAPTQKGKEYDGKNMALFEVGCLGS